MPELVRGGGQAIPTQMLLCQLPRVKSRENWQWLALRWGVGWARGAGHGDYDGVILQEDADRELTHNGSVEGREGQEGLLRLAHRVA